MVESCSGLPRCDDMAHRTEQTKPELPYCKTRNIFKWPTFGGHEFTLLLIYSHVQMKCNLQCLHVASLSKSVINVTNQADLHSVGLFVVARCCIVDGYYCCVVDRYCYFFQVYWSLLCINSE